MSSTDTPTPIATLITQPSPSATAWRFGPPAPITDENAVKYLNLVLLFIFIFFAVSALPKALVRFNSGHNYKQGWLMTRSIPGQPKPPKPRHVKGSAPSRQASGKSDRSHRTFVNVDMKGGYSSNGHSDETKVASDEYNILQVHKLKKASGTAPQTYRGPPTHVQSWATLLYPISTYLDKKIYGFSIGRLSLYVAYFTLGMVCLLYYVDPTKNVRRSGWIVVSQYPVIILLASKNNFLGMILGLGYEKINHIHRWIGKFTFMACLFHVVGYLVIWTKRGNLTSNSFAQGPAWVAFGGLCILACMSLPIVRRSAYRIFIYSHHIGYLTMLVAINFHIKTAIPWTLACGFIIGLDHIMRFIKSYLIVASIHTVPDMGCTRIEIPFVTKGWRAGQHIRIRAVNHRMGLFSWMEAHPFTIASVAELPECGGGQGVVLYVKKAGDWTKRLYDLADNYNRARPEADEKAKGSGMGSTTMKFIVDGPYGGPGHTVFSSYTAGILVCGGSGITFGLAATEEMIRDIEIGASRVRLIHLVWVVQEHSNLLALLDQFNSFIKRAARLPALRMKISIHYTRASKLLPTANRHRAGLQRNASTSSEERRLTIEYDLPHGMHLRAGRPKLSTILDAFVEKCSTLNAVALPPKNTNADRGGMVERYSENYNGILVGVCGPVGLADDVKRTVGGVSRKARMNVGGVEVFEETFGW